VDAAGVLLDLFEIAEDRRAGAQLGVLVDVELGVVDLLRLEAVELQLLLAQRAVGGEVF
jgi:hypothetical protein